MLLAMIVANCIFFTMSLMTGNWKALMLHAVAIAVCAYAYGQQQEDK